MKVAVHTLLIAQVSAGTGQVPAGGIALLTAATTLLLLVLYLRLRRERTRFRQVQAELRASNSTYRSLIDSVTELIYVQDLETGEFLDVNDAVVQAYGYAREEILGKTPSVLADPERVDIEDTIVRFREAASGMPQRFEWWGRTRDGAVFPKEVVLVLGEYFGQPAIIAVARDISERLAAQESMRLRTEEYREIFEADLAGNFVGLPDGSLEACNEAFCRIAGYDAIDEALTRGMPPLEEPGHGTRQLVELLNGTGRVDARELDLQRRDGRTVRVLLHARGVFRDHKLIRVYGHFLDITEQKVLTERIRDAQKMEAVGLLAGGVAHDFNNALTTVQGHADLLLEEVEEGDPIREGLEEIRRSAERAGRLTRKLLAFSRRRVLRPRVVDLGSLVRDSAGLLQQLLGEDVELDLWVEPGSGSVRADPGEVEQLLINLLLNAREALPRVGRVEVRIRNCQVPGCPSADGQVEAGSYVLLQVSDDGVGMDERVRARMFEPFFTTKSEAEGRGLGLATVYGIVRDAGGRVWAESAPGEGSTFNVCLPCVAESPVDRPSRAGISASTDVLLAEDEPGVRRLTRRLLEKEGYRVHEAADGRAALDLALSRVEPFKLLVTDVVMPGLQGTELADQLAARQPSLRVLFMSGYTESDRLRDQALAPGQAFLAKPFTPAGLREAVRELMESDPQPASR